MVGLHLKKEGKYIKEARKSFYVEGGLVPS